MKAAVISNIVLDHIEDSLGNTIARSLGGPACYCSLTARKFNFSTVLVTKVGSDFSSENRQVLAASGIHIKQNQIVQNYPTTSFRIRLKEDERDLFLYSRCQQLGYEDFSGTDADCWIVSPVLDELPIKLIVDVIKNSKEIDFLLLDPQGYLRTVNSLGEVLITGISKLDFPMITAIKVNEKEQAELTHGLRGVEAMRSLQTSMRIRFVILTENYRIHLLYGDTHYWLNIPYIDTQDNTGAGDILSAAFTCSYLKEKDPLWAICFGGGAVRAALETKLLGLSKVPPKSKIENCATYYYNTVSFQTL
jgi:sugar/nucleoside kinase (ribokinase family)